MELGTRPRLDTVIKPELLDRNTEGVVYNFRDARNHHIYCRNTAPSVSDTVFKVEPNVHTSAVKEEADTCKRCCALGGTHDDRELLATDLINKVEPQIGSSGAHDAVKLEVVKEDTVGSKDSAWYDLYIDHEVKDELVLGPIVLQRPGPVVPLAHCSTVIKAEPDEDKRLVEAVADTSKECGVAQDDRELLRLILATDLINKVEPKVVSSGAHDAKLNEVQEELVLVPTVLQHSGPVVPLEDHNAGVSEQVNSESIPRAVGASDRSGDEICRVDISAAHTSVGDELRATVTRTSCKTHAQAKYMQIFSKHENFRGHMRKGKSLKGYKSNMYNKKLVQNLTFKTHRLMQTGERHSVCDNDFPRKDKLKRHTRTHAREKRYKYDVSSKEFTKKNNLNTPMLTHTGEKQHKCDVCSKKFALKRYLNRHMLTHTEERPHKCDVCSKKFALTSNLNRHMLTHTGEKAHKCDLCSKEFPWKNKLKLHMRTHTVGTRYKCDVCSKEFKWNSSLMRHMLTHTGEKAHKCYVCSKEFALKSNLISHMHTHTGEMANKCDLCGKKFAWKNSLKLHILTHTDGTRYKCDVCSKEFKWKRSLIRHMLTHTGEEAHKCYVCSKEFTLKSYLISHIYTHTGEMANKCDLCGKKFAWNSRLKSHMLTHTDGTRYKCDVCSKEFKWKKSLIRHILTHIGEKAHKCYVCSKKFTWKHSLNLHMLTHTGEPRYKLTCVTKSLH